MTGGLPKAVLVDMDDTVVHSAAARDRAWQAVSDRLREEVPDLDADSVDASIRGYRRWYWSDPHRHRVGRLNALMSVRDQVRGALEGLGLDPRLLADDLAAWFLSRYEEALAPFPSAVDTLVRLRSLGIRLGMITNGDAVYQRRKIARFGLERHFDHVLVEGEFGLGKPDERVYLHALECLGARPADAWMIGDNLDWDIAAPQRLGMFAVWVDGEGEGVPGDNPVRPDRIVRSLPEVMEGSPFSSPA